MKHYETLRNIISYMQIYNYLKTLKNKKFEILYSISKTFSGVMFESTWLKATDPENWWTEA